MDAERVRLVFWTSIGVIGTLMLWLYASSPETDGGRARWRQWWSVVAPIGAAVFQHFVVFRWHGVNRYQDDSDDYVEPAPQTTQTDHRQTDRQPVSTPSESPSRLQLDRTRTAVIEELLTHGWNVGEIRSVVKGDNGTIGAEIDAARQRLGIDVEPRTIPVKERGGDTRYVALDEDLGMG